MTDEHLDTLADVRDRLDELLDEKDPDTPVFTDADGVILDGVRITEHDDRTVFY